jgi:hypothetical protein
MKYGLYIVGVICALILAYSFGYHQGNNNFTCEQCPVSACDDSQCPDYSCNRTMESDFERCEQDISLLREELSTCEYNITRLEYESNVEYANQMIEEIHQELRDNGCILEYGVLYCNDKQALNIR